MTKVLKFHFEEINHISCIFVENQRKLKLLIIDNYDSFTYNLFHYVAEYEPDVDVLRSDAFALHDLEKYQNIILSPGPGLPGDAGLMPGVIERYHSRKRILGICLGHQALFEFFGGRLINLKEVLHGMAVQTFLETDKSYIFENIPPQIKTGRYHSYVADNQWIPDDLEIIATDVYGRIQGIKHRYYDIIGLQFQPESILTEYGKDMIRNWLSH